MSAPANIIAFDGAATPVSHTLNPIFNGVDADGLASALWRESSAAVPLAAQVTMKLTERKLKSGVTESTCLVSVPVMEVVTGSNAAGYSAAPAIAYTDTVVIKTYFSPRSTIAGRRLARQLALNIAGNISTSVTPVTTGPVPELFDQAIMAS